MDKHQTYARSRVPGRNEFPRPNPRSGSALAAARRVAIRFVADHMPALASVEPEVNPQPAGQRPSPALLARLGLTAADIAQRRPASAYTFTFAGQCSTSDGALAPIVAAVTVDRRRQIVVKTSLSK